MAQGRIYQLGSHVEAYIPYFFDQTPRLLFILLLILCGSYSRAAFVFRKPGDINYGWIGKVRVRFCLLLDAVSGTHSFSVLLSAMRTTRTTQTVLALAWWPSSKIICRRVCVPRLPTAATVQGRRLFHSRASVCVATIRGQPLFEGGVYSKKYGMYNFYLWLPHTCM